MRARRIKEARRLSAVTPYDKATSCPSMSFSGQDTETEESEAEYNCHDILARGFEFLKRSKNGVIYAPLFVRVYISSFASFGKGWRCHVKCM